MTLAARTWPLALVGLLTLLSPASGQDAAPPIGAGQSAPPVQPAPVQPTAQLIEPDRAIRDSFVEIPELQAVNVVDAVPGPAQQVVLFGTLPEGFDPRRVEQEAADVLNDYASRNLLAWPSTSPIVVDASNLIVLDRRDTAGLIGSLDRLATQLASGRQSPDVNRADRGRSAVVCVQRFDAARGILALHGVVQSDDLRKALGEKMTNLRGVKSVESDGVVVIDDIDLTFESVGLTTQGALARRSGPEMLTATDTLLLSDRDNPRTWQLRAIGHLWNKDWDAAVGAVRVAQTLGADSEWGPERFQGPLRVVYHELQALGPMAALLKR